MNIRPLLVSAGAVALFAGSARAQTLVSNMHLQRQQSGWICSGAMSTAMSFTPASAATISGVTMWGFGMIRTTPLEFNIHADDNNKPGEVLFNLVGPNPEGWWANYFFNAVAVPGSSGQGVSDKLDSSGNVIAGNRYWVVGRSQAVGAIYGWGHTNEGGGQIGQPGWAISDNPMVRHNGGAWENTNWIPSQFTIHGQPVPEPSALLALGLGGVALWRRGRK